MVRQTLEIPAYDWECRCFYRYSHLDTDEIADALRDIGCRGDTLASALASLQADTPDSGLCYSNYAARRSVIVIARTDSPGELANSVTHEIYHLTAHICQACRIAPSSETAAYLIGNLAQATHPALSPLYHRHCPLPRHP